MINIRGFTALLGGRNIYKTTIASSKLLLSCCLLGGLLSLPIDAPAEATPFESPLDNSLYHLATEQNDASAQYLIGRKYFTGSSVEKNIDEAIKWFELAATQKHTKAQFQLGKMYLYGEEGVKANYVYALGYLRDAANSSYAEAQFELGNYYLMGKTENVDYPQAIKWYRAAAEQQHVRAMLALGKILYEGRGGIKPQPEDAKHYLSLAAEAGDSDAMQYMREISKHTTSPHRNNASITEFHTKLNEASAGHIPSQYEIGMAYLKGTGVDADVELAAKWMRRAAINDHAEAQYMMSHLYRDGVGVEKNLKRALDWLQIAASAGVRDAQKELESMHLSKSSLVDASDLNEVFNQAASHAPQADPPANNNGAGAGKPLPTNESSEPPVETAKSTSTSQQDSAMPQAKKKDAIALAAATLNIPSLELQPINAEQQFQLANKYLTGKKMDKDISRALYWFEQAAKQNHTQAQFKLGEMYKRGIGVTASAAKAKYWLSKAADGGSRNAGKLLEDLRGIKLVENSVVNSSRDRNSQVPRPKTEEKALKKPAAVKANIQKKQPDVTAELAAPPEANHPINGQNNLNQSGSDQVNHDLVSQNQNDRGQDHSQDHSQDNHETNGGTNGNTDNSGRTSVAMLSELGKGQQATADADKDLQWLIQSANNNNLEAQLKLADMYFHGRGVQRDLLAAADWYHKAADEGSAEAQFNLGDMYKQGLGVEKDNAKAIKWYRKAANQGHETAMRRLGGCRIC